MVFTFDSELRKAASIITGTITVGSLLMAITVAEGAGTVFLLLQSLLLGLITAAIMTATYVVSIDKSHGTILKSMGALNLVSNRRYPISEFQGVGIVTAGRSSSFGGSVTVYSVQLIGRENIKLPGGNTNRNDILVTAQQVSEYLSLPLDKTPRMGFFGKRL